MLTVFEQKWDAFRSNPSEDAFAALFEGSSRWVYAVCHRMADDESAAMAAFQQFYNGLMRSACSSPAVPPATSATTVLHEALALLVNYRPSYWARKPALADDILSLLDSAREQDAPAEIPESLVAGRVFTRAKFSLLATSLGMQEYPALSPPIRPQTRIFWQRLKLGLIGAVGALGISAFIILTTIALTSERAVHVKHIIARPEPPLTIPSHRRPVAPQPALTQTANYE